MAVSVWASSSSTIPSSKYNNFFAAAASSSSSFSNSSSLKFPLQRLPISWVCSPSPSPSRPRLLPLVKFWHDCCCGDQPLKEAYLDLYDIVIDKEALVESYLVRQGVGERRIWDVRFFCDFNDWELEIVVDFLLILESNSPISEDGDLMWWVPKKKGVKAKKQTFSSFDDLLTNSDKPVLVDFYATWCGPCQFMAPILNEVSTQLKDTIQVVKIDTEKYPSIANKYKIEALPTFIIFKDGEPYDRFEVIEDGILRFYKNLYTEDKTHLPHPDVLNFSKITRDKAGWLEQLFDEGEIFGMLKDFNGDKAPGPDELFSINRNEEAYVADLMKFSNGVLHWDLSFIRVIQDWELDSLSNFMESVYGVLLRGVGKDKICWMPAKKMSFEVGSYYRVLTESSDQSFPWKSTWKPKDLSRVAFLFGLQEGALSADQLIQRIENSLKVKQ
uniref:Thioredoxin domain-containing protein n=1 Tax=Quercus lobata TaxID=97700 RepID=A0A7N2KVU8_QUELO